MKRAGLAAVLAAALASASAAAQPLVVPSRVARVTVFPDRALVTRVVEVELPAGDSAVAVEGLPAGLLEDSLRVEGRSEAPLGIGSLEAGRAFSEELVREKERELHARLEALRDEARSWSDRAKALGQQLAFIQALGKKLPERFDAEMLQGRVEPEAWKQTWAAVGAGAAETLAGIQEAEVRQREVAEKIRKAEQELAQVATGRREEVRVTVNVASARPARAVLELSYQVPGAGWAPAYDARLDAEAATVALDLLARVRQRTGEEWAGVALTLSTARPAQGAEVPRLFPWLIDFVSAVPLARSKGMLAREAAMDQAAAGAVPAEAEFAAEPLAAQEVAGEFAAEYRLPGPVTVPADGEPHQFSLGARTLPARLSVRAVPKVVPAGFLLARVRPEGDSPLLPGPVALHRGGAFVGRARLELTRPGQEIELSFGVDDRVRVEYAFDTGEKSKEGIFEKRRRVERRYRIEVANHHGRAMDVAVLDQLPVPQDERIRVELLEDGTAPTSRDPEGVRGVLAWEKAYAPGEKGVIRFGYAVVYPEGEVVPGF